MRYDILEFRDGQDLSARVDTLRQLTAVVEQWLGRGDGGQVVVDFTGGTKCMPPAPAVRISVQQGAESRRNTTHLPKKTTKFPRNTARCWSVQRAKAEGMGLEPTTPYGAPHLQ